MEALGADGRPLRDRIAGHLPRIRSVVQKVAGGRRDLDDISQECCVRIIEKERLWSGREGTLAAWIAAVSRNVAFRHLGRRHRRESRTVPLDEERTITPEPSPDAPDVSEDQIRWILDQFARLPATQREVLHMRYYKGMRTIDIAETLGIAPQSVSERVTNGIRTLQRQARRRGILAILFPWWWDWSEASAAASTAAKARAVVAATLFLGAGAAGGGYAVWRVAEQSTPAETPSPSNEAALQLQREAGAEGEAARQLKLLARENERLRNALLASRIDPPLPVAWDRVEAALALLKKVAPDEYAQMTVDQLARTPYLALFNRVLTGEDLSPLVGLPNLKSLNLSGSSVTDANLRQLHGLSLDVLLLYDTYGVTDANVAEIAFPTLRELCFMNNSITDAGLKPLAGLASLTRLTLTGTRVSGEGLAALPPGITHLILTNTPVTPEELLHLRRLPLEELHLSLTCVGGRGIEALRGMTSLKRLSLYSADVTDASLAAVLPTLTGLEFLSLAGKPLAGEGWLRELQGLPSLREIGLEGMSIADDTFLDFVPPAPLHRLSLGRTVISEEAIRIFRGRHPGIDVRR